MLVYSFWLLSVLETVMLFHMFVETDTFLGFFDEQKVPKEPHLFGM